MDLILSENQIFFRPQMSCKRLLRSIFLGVMVYIQSEKHKADTNKLTEQQQRQEDIYKMEEGKYREQDVLIRTCPAIYFEKIDYVSKPSSDLPINFTTSNLLKINFENKYTLIPRFNKTFAAILA